MYDITRFASIKNVDAWLQVLMKGLKETGNKIPILLVGGKKDLEKNRSVEINYVKDIADKNRFYDFIECSSITGENVERIFLSIGKKMLEKSNL